MTKLASVCVYCGSGDGRDPAFGEAADALGRALAREGVSLVYGGGSIGLMGRLAKATLGAGGHVVGVIPRFLHEREVMLRAVSELVVTEDMHERKRIMYDRADAFVALPGGIGTLEELVEMMTWAQLGRHAKPILVANVRGFWNPLIALFDHMVEMDFIRPGLDLTYLVTDGVEEIVPRLRTAVETVTPEEARAEAETVSRM